MRRLLTAAALAALAALPLLPGAGTAAADAGGNASLGGAGINQGASNTGSEPGGTSTGEAVCTYTPIAIPAGVPVYDENGQLIVASGEGGWYEKRCDGNTFAGVFYLANRPPAELAAEATRYLPLPAPSPLLSPTGDQVVNLATWLWIDPADWTELQSTVSVPGVSVTVTARPEQVIWQLGDGDTVTCFGPGTPYDPTRPAAARQPGCSHTFTRSTARLPGRAIDAAVTLRWRASWTVTGAAGGGELGVIDRTTTFPIRVGEVQALNVASG